MIPLVFDDIVYIVEDKEACLRGQYAYKQVTPLRKNTYFYSGRWCNNYIAASTFVRCSRLHLFEAFNYLDEEIPV